MVLILLLSQRVILGKTAFENVPPTLKAAVAENVIDAGLPEFIPVENGGTKE